MATTYVFARGSRFGETEFPDFDPDGTCNSGEIERMRDAYVAYLDREIEKYDSTLIWFPELSEVWGEVGNTKSDPLDFEDWFLNSGVCEKAMCFAWGD